MIGCISYQVFKKFSFDSNLSVTAPEFLVLCKPQPGFLIVLFLNWYPVLLSVD